MGKNILSPKQLKFLELASATPSIVKNFYLTGGTALAEFYLHHRLSEDIDLFCEKEEVDQKLVEAYLKKITPAMEIREIKRSNFLGLYSYQLVFFDGSKLKVDFNYYPFLPISSGKKFGKLKIDSLEDIAVNKVHTIFMKARSRDYIDLYFILKTNKDFSIERLISLADAKFDWHIDPFQLASAFLRAKDITDLPEMLVPFDPKKMVDFFLTQAKELKSGGFKS